MLNTKYRVAISTGKVGFVIRGEPRKIRNCLTDLRLRLEGESRKKRRYFGDEGQHVQKHRGME